MSLPDERLNARLLALPTLGRDAWLYACAKGDSLPPPAL